MENNKTTLVPMCRAHIKQAMREIGINKDHKKVH